jgi:4-cresol dehydrogenase (hydroxylating)
LAENKDPDWSGHVWFSPNIPQTGESLRKANRVFQEGCDKVGIYWGWSGGICFFPKSYTLLHAFQSGGDVETDRKTREGFAHVVRIAAENGWSEYRTAPAFYDLIMDVFSFNNHSLRRFHETIKDAVDPNGILSPGRFGIWPKHMRKDRA